MLLLCVFLLLTSSCEAAVFKIGAMYGPALSSYQDLIEGAVEDINSRDDILPDQELAVEHVLLQYEDPIELIQTKRDMDGTNVTALIILERHLEGVELEADSIPGVPRLYVSPGVPAVLPAGVSLYPGDGMLADVLSDVVQEYAWRSMVVIYDDILGLDSLGRFVDSVAERGNRVVYMRVRTNLGPTADPVQLRELLIRVRETHEEQIILHCDVAVTREVLEEAKNFVLLRKETHWIITNLDAGSISDLTTCEFTQVTLTTFGIVPLAQRNESVLQALGADAVTTVALALDQSIRQGNDPQSIDWSRNGTLLNLIKQVSFGGRTGWVSFNQGGGRRNVSIDVIEDVSGNHTTAGSWSDVEQTLGLVESHADGPFIFGNKPLRVVALLLPPWVTKRVDSENFQGIDKYEGFLVDLLKVLSERLNFTIDVEKMYEDRLTDKDVKRHFDEGVHLGMVMKSMRESRRKYYDLSPELVEFGYTIFTPKPVKELTGLLAFLTPLSPLMWTFFALALVIVSLCLTMVNHWNPYEWRGLAKRGQVEPSEGRYYNAWNSMWNVYSATVGQGAENPPRSFAGKIISGSWWFFVLVVMASYTANLAAFLAVKPTNPIKSMGDLARQSKLEYGFIRSYSIRRLFETADTFPLRDMWRKIRANPDWLVESNEEGLKRAAKGKYAFITFSGVRFRPISELCAVEMVGQPFYKYHVAFPIPIGSPLKIKIAEEIERIRQIGVIEELSNRWLDAERGRCKQSNLSKDDGVLKMDNLLGLFVILAAISAMGLAVCVIEVIIFKLKKLESENIEEEGGSNDIELGESEGDVMEEREEEAIEEEGEELEDMDIVESTA